jgi:rifampin ADP-ribosylating transferase
MKFSPRNSIVRLCIQGMHREEGGYLGEAHAMFTQAWNEATDDHERLLAAYHIFRLEDDPRGHRKWLEIALELAERVDDVSIRAAVPFLHTRLAECHEKLNDRAAAERLRTLVAAWPKDPTDAGPFYHGTRADLKDGDLLSAGNRSNYEPGLIMRHIYFTALVDGAGLAAALSRGEGAERVYVVQPMGRFEDDPNVTNKRFPGNPTRSYRSEDPLKIVGEVFDWERPAPEEVARWRARVAETGGGIIN